ncbi:MAG: hypothetical protein HQK59_02610 [Deltaproteobacteria bacterium]|nr:hypothetical protein [Deltaproteobacteria bacterium]
MIVSICNNSKHEKQNQHQPQQGTESSQQRETPDSLRGEIDYLGKWSRSLEEGIEADRSTLADLNTKLSQIPKINLSSQNLMIRVSAQDAKKDIIVKINAVERDLSDREGMLTFAQNELARLQKLLNQF